MMHRHAPGESKQVYGQHCAGHVEQKEGGTTRQANGGTRCETMWDRLRADDR